MIRRAYRWLWEDLGMDGPHPARCLCYVGLAVLLSLGIWALVIAVVLT
jgi:hypothetical protein